MFEFFKNLGRKFCGSDCECSKKSGNKAEDKNHNGAQFNGNPPEPEFFVYSPMDGEAIPIEKTDDEAFAQKLLGHGVTIVPTSGEVLCPVDGEVVHVFDTLHAYGICSENGAEILIHVGINTVELKGEGFETFVKVGQKVKVGDKIAHADLEFLESKGYCTHTPVVVTNSGDVKDISYNYGTTQAGKSQIIRFRKQN